MCQKIPWTGIIKTMRLLYQKRRLLFKTLTINLLCIFLLLTLSYAQNTTLSKIETAYKNIDDASGNFIQISYIKELGKTQKFNGKFFIKGDKIRWQYFGKFSQVVYLNRKMLTVYDKTNKQAIQSSFTEDKYGQLPIALLSRMADIKKDFEITENKENTLILVPKTKMGNIKRIELVINENEFPIKSLKITDTMANIITVEFNNVKINTNLKDSLFNFTPREDDTVLQY